MKGVTRGNTAETSAFECLSSRRRRVTLSVLGSRSDPLPVDELVARVADRTADGSDPTPRERVRALLHHVDLPKLAEAGFVARHDGAVELADHPVLADPVVEQALDSPLSEDRLDAVFAALADARRQRVLRVLREMGHALAPREIAILVAAREADTSPQNVPVEAVDPVHAAIHHVHLPKLDEAGLVERRDDGTVTDDASDVPVTSRPAAHGNASGEAR